MEGWTQDTDMDAVTVARRFEDAGVCSLIVTDIDRDGALLGFNVEVFGALADAVSIPVIAAGGLASVRDIEHLVERSGTPIAGAVLGRALYAGTITPRGSPGGGGLMLKVRVIPCLDVKDGRVVKGVQFVDLRDAGDPVEQARSYDAAGADELMFLDITASHEGRGAILDVIARTAEVCFMPLSVGGGVRTVEDAAPPAARGRRQGQRQHRRGGDPGPDLRHGRRLRLPGRGRRRRRPTGRRRAVGDLHLWRAQGHRASTPAPTPREPVKRGRARSCSPPWTGTAPRAATISTSSRR